MGFFDLPRWVSPGLVFTLILSPFSAGCYSRTPAPTPGFMSRVEDKSEEQVRREKKHQEDLAADDENMLLIRSGVSVGDKGIIFGRDDTAVFTIQDVEAIAKRCPAVVAVAPVVGLHCELVFGSQKWVPTYLLGTTHSYLVVRDWTKLTEGRIFSEDDIKDAKAVCLVGKSVAKNVFVEASPVGKEIKIQGNVFRVIGVLSEKGRNSLGMDQDDVVLMPWTTSARLLAGKLREIAAKAASKEKSAVAVKEITKALREEHHIPEVGANDFTIIDLARKQ
jgi:putative ABC transport system permease protein